MLRTEILNFCVLTISFIKEKSTLLLITWKECQLLVHHVIFYNGWNLRVKCCLHGHVTLVNYQLLLLFLSFSFYFHFVQNGCNLHCLFPFPFSFIICPLWEVLSSVWFSNFLVNPSSAPPLLAFIIFYLISKEFFLGFEVCLKIFAYPWNCFKL